MTALANRRLVSVIIPCHNYARFLPDAVGSVLDQSYSPIEIIVVDDGSTDDTAQVARDFGDRVRLIQIPHSGPAAARNAGLRAASGEYVQFLDADDRLERRKVETHVRYLESHPEIGLVYGDARCFTTEQPDLRWFKRVPGGGDGPWIEGRAREEGSWLQKLVGAPIFHSCCPVFRISMVRQIGFLDESLPASEDWEFWIRAAAAGVGIAYADGDDALALIRFTGQGLTGDQRLMRVGHLAMRRVIARYLTDDMRLRNYVVGCAAVRRYCRPAERPLEVMKLLVANWGPSLRSHLIRTKAKAAGECWTGRGARWLFRQIVPYSMRHAVRKFVGINDCREP